MELEQFAMFEENYDKVVKEAQFQTEAQFSFYKGISVLCCRISVDMSAMAGPLAKVVPPKDDYQSCSRKTAKHSN